MILSIHPDIHSYIHYISNNISPCIAWFQASPHIIMLFEARTFILSLLWLLSKIAYEIMRYTAVLRVLR